MFGKASVSNSECNTELFRKVFGGLILGVEG